MNDLFVAVHGQDDNIGDPGLRRAMLDGLGPGMRRHVLIGHASPAYRSGLGLLADDVTYTTRKEWQATAMKSAARGRASYVSNAGEIQLNPRRRQINRADAALVALIRARGGVAMTTGMGVRTPSGPPSRMLSTLSRMCSLSLWRDLESRDFVGHGAVAPDWAFALGDDEALTADGRDTIIVSMRGDHPPPGAEWFRTVREASDRLSTQILVVTQVERDRERSDEIARALDARTLPWHGGDFRAAEEELRAVYRRSLLAVGDRLHVLIFAATEGAVPVSLPARESLKIPRTLRVVGLGDHEVGHGTPVDAAVDRLGGLAGSISETQAAIKDARIETRSVKHRMNELLPS